MAQAQTHPELAGGNSWADRANRHPQDALLRCHGYRIVARPRNGVALWRRPGCDGSVVTQEQAVEEVRRRGGKTE